MIDEIGHETTCSGITERLSRIPQGIDAFYGRILGQIRDQPIRDQRRFHAITQILWLVAIAIRPLTIEELGEAVTTLASMSIGAKSNTDRASTLKWDRPIKDYIEQCSPLLVRRGNFGVFFHYSDKNFLLDSTRNILELKDFNIDAAESHLRVARLLLYYLKQSPLNDKPVVSQDDHTFEEWPGLRYAASHWCDHARRCGIRSREILESANFMLDQDSMLRQYWWQTYISLQSQRKDKGKELMLHMNRRSMHWLGKRQRSNVKLTSAHHHLCTWSVD